jgi:phosphate transport system protein
MPKPRETFDRQIKNIQDEILILGGMVEEAMSHAIESLKQRDIRAAKEIYEKDLMINEKRFALENAILIVIATQQPMARDLRLIASMLEIITELERMGDYAKGIAKVVVRLGDAEIQIPEQDFDKMCAHATDMLHRALRAFISEDASEARIIPHDDDEVDALYNKIYRNVVEAMIAKPETIDQANLLMWVAHNIERMADRVTNICERTVFIATGELMEISPTDDEDMDVDMDME